MTQRRFSNYEGRPVLALSESRHYVKNTLRSRQRTADRRVVTSAVDSFYATLASQNRWEAIAAELEANYPNPDLEN